MIKIEMCPVKIFDYKLNADLNKKVFNLDLKIAKVGLCRINKGKLFHSLYAYTSIIKRGVLVSKKNIT